MNRTTEMVLGIIGSLIGFGGAIFAMFFGVIDEAFMVSSEISIMGLGVSAFVFSAFAILGSILVKFKPRLGGGIMFISGLAILISISFCGIIPALFLIPAGLMGLVRKPTPNF